MSESGSTEDESEVGSSVVQLSLTEGPEFMTKDLIAMILQYMEASGLHESYKSLWNECESYGYPMPSEGQSVLLESLEFGPREANLLFKYFDLEEKENLLIQWTRFIQAMEPEQQEDFQKITFFVRIFAATIPFRRDEPEEAKSKALSELRQFFQEKTDEFSTDEKMLSLFALPFIADPASHPVFKEIFQDAWKTKLRSQLSLSIKKFCEFKNLPTIGSTDLAQLYLSQQEQDWDADEKSGSNSEPMSGGRQTAQNPTLQSLHQNLKSTQSSLLHVELRYHKLLKVAAEMVAALESAVQGKIQNMARLRSRVSKVFPELFPKNSRGLTDANPVETDSEGSSSYDAEEESDEDTKLGSKSEPILPDIHDQSPDEDEEQEQEASSAGPSPESVEKTLVRKPPQVISSSRSSKTRAVVASRTEENGRSQSRHPPHIPITPQPVPGAAAESVKKVASKVGGAGAASQGNVKGTKSTTGGKKAALPAPSSGSKTTTQLLSRKRSNLGVER